MVQTDIGITESDRQRSAALLSGLLADEYVLFTKLYKYHWNIKGMAFGPLHKLFEDQYQALFVFIDEVAERIRAIGHVAPGTLQEFLQLTSLTEEPGKNPSQEDMIADLLHDQEAIIKHIRSMLGKTEELNDMGTNNFVNDLLEKHEKQAWMIRAHLNA
jgi:starvation-inducible DNA-binding protein